MPLQGNAILSIWNDVDPVLRPEYDRWITQEHMHERMQASGFLRGRRYMAADPDAAQPYLNMYEIEDIGTCSSPEYQAMLNAPTPWTKRMMPALRNFTRGAFRTVYSAGNGIAGCIGSIQISALRAGGENSLHAVMPTLLPVGHNGVMGVHMGEVNEWASGGMTEEKKLRGSGPTETDFTHVIFIESVDEAALASTMDAVSKAFADTLFAERILNPSLYRLNYMI